MLIKVFLTDIDGCLTDGGIYAPSTHLDLFCRKFNTRDMLGMRLLYNAGIKVGIVSTSANVCETEFARACPYAIIISNAHDKAAEVAKKFINSDTYWENVAFIGDDINDIDLLKLVGIPACPIDAASEVVDIVRSRNGHVSMFKGGDGAVRNFSNHIRFICNIPTKWE